MTPASVTDLGRLSESLISGFWTPRGDGVRSRRSELHDKGRTSMASRGKKKTTMAKLTRESRLRERRLDKAARKDARKRASAEYPGQPGAIYADLPGDDSTSQLGDDSTGEPGEDQSDEPSSLVRDEAQQS